MPPQKNQYHKIILIAISMVVVIMGVMLFINPAAVFPDPSWGFQVMRAMQLGGGFNLATRPDQVDIKNNYSEFLSWWSPGQYLVPYFFKLILRITTGQAASLTTTVFSFSGIYGYYCFFKKTGFTPAIAAISILFIVTQEAFVIPYVFYNGGELLLFGFGGWFLYGCASIEKPGWRLVLFLLISGIAGFFCKSSFLWMFAAGCCYLWISLSVKTTGLIAWIRNGIWIGIPSILSLFIIYHFYLSKGTNPASGGGGLKFVWSVLGFPMASPILSAFSIDDFSNGLLFHTDDALLSPFWSVTIVVLSAILSILLIITIIRKVPHQKYALLLAVFYSIAILFFGQSYLRQATISYEARHYRLLGLLIIPGIIYLLSKTRPVYRIGFGVICLTIAFLSCRYFITSYELNKNENARGTSGISQAFIDQPSLDYIMALDKKNTKAIFAFVSPDIGLEISHNRIITIEPIDDPGIKLDYDDFEYDGHAGPLYIVLPSEYNDGRAAMVKKFFPGYTDFKMTLLSEDYLLYSAK